MYCETKLLNFAGHKFKFKFKFAVINCRYAENVQNRYSCTTEVLQVGEIATGYDIIIYNRMFLVSATKQFVYSEWIYIQKMKVLIQ